MEKISWTDRVRSKVVLHRVKEQRNIVHTLKRRKGNWIGHILCRNCHLKQVIDRKVEGIIEVTGRRGKGGKQLPNDLKEENNIVYTVNRRKVNWIGYIWGRNCFLKQVFKRKVEGMIEVTERRGKRGKQLLNGLKVESNIAHTVNRREVNWIGHIFCRYCLLKQVIERKVEGIIEVTGRRGKGGKQLLNYLKEENNIVHTVNRWKVNWIGYIWGRNCLLKQVFKRKVEGMIEVTERRGKRGKQLLNGLKVESNNVHTVNRREVN